MDRVDPATVDSAASGADDQDLDRCRNSIIAFVVSERYVDVSENGIPLRTLDGG